MDCLFCKIINKKAPADIVYENDKTICFKDINPVAPVHILIVPKKHIGSINDISEEDKELMGELLLVAKKVAKDLGVDKGYKLAFNVGEEGGQIVPHLHLHLVSGKISRWP
jgi:histidine triad (HIT) family protein